MRDYLRPPSPKQTTSLGQSHAGLPKLPVVSARAYVVCARAEGAPSCASRQLRGTWDVGTCRRGTWGLGREDSGGAEAELAWGSSSALRRGVGLANPRWLQATFLVVISAFVAIVNPLSDKALLGYV